MTIRSESRLEVAGTADTVFAYVADAQRWPEWAFGILECRVSGDQPMREGSRLEQRAKMFGSTSDRTLSVTAVEAPRCLAFAGTMGPSPMRFGFDLTPTSGGTEAMLWIEVEPQRFMRVIPSFLLRRMFRRVNLRELTKIKTATDGTPSTPVSVR